jgi:hypothetical protein
MKNTTLLTCLSSQSKKEEPGIEETREPLRLVHTRSSKIMLLYSRIEAAPKKGVIQIIENRG